MIKLLVLLLTISMALGNPTNANGVCNVKDIGYHQTGGPTPTITGVPTKYVASKAYTLTIAGDTNFLGFVFYATRGTMALTSVTPATGTGGPACGGSAVQHNDRNPKTRVVASWTAPDTPGQRVEFGSLMVKDLKYGSATVEIAEEGGAATAEGSAARAGAGESYQFKISVVYTSTDMAAFTDMFPKDMAAALSIKSASRITVVKAAVSPLGTEAERLTEVVFTLSNPTRGTVDDPILTDSDVVSRINDVMAMQATTNTGPLVNSATLSQVAVGASIYSQPQGSGMKSKDSGVNAGLIAIICAAGVFAVVGGVGAMCYLTRGSRNKTVSGVSSAPMISSKPIAAATSDWTKVFDENTKSYYYFNSKTNESSWTKPPGVNI